ncbi:MAG: GNAT family N-acetyltransferase [Planctomycetota bacterium]
MTTVDRAPPATTIRPYQAGDESAILRTFNIVFRETNGEGYVDRGMPFWRWQYLDNPEGHRVWVAVTADGTVAAHYGGVPYRVATPAGETTFVHIVDSFVHPSFRAGLKAPGLFVCTALPWFRDCYVRGDAVAYGFPVPRAERIGQRYLHYHRLRVIDYLCRDLGEERAADPTVSVAPITQLAEGSESAARVDGLFAAFRRERACLTVRSARYLRWRYLTPPGVEFEVVGAQRGDRLVGLMVLARRVELVPDSCAIVDWMVPGDDEGVTSALLGHAVARGRDAGRANLLAVFADSSPEFANLQRAGFTVVSSSLHFERRLNYQVFAHDLSEPFLREHWWYTLGDSDLV